MFFGIFQDKKLHHRMLVNQAHLVMTIHDTDPRPRIQTEDRNV